MINLARYVELQELLNQNPAFPLADNGQQARVDSSMRNNLDQECRNIHRQIYGPIVMKNGTVLDHAEKRHQDSQKAKTALELKYNNDTTKIMEDPEGAITAHWALCNEMRYDIYCADLEDAMSNYKTFTNEDWKADRPVTNSVRKVDPKTLTGEQKARLAACFAANTKGKSIPETTVE